MKIELLSGHEGLTLEQLGDDLDLTQCMLAYNSVLLDNVRVLLEGITSLCVDGYLEFEGISPSFGNHTGYYDFRVNKTIGIIRRVREEWADTDLELINDIPVEFNLQKKGELVVWYEPNDFIKFTTTSLLRKTPQGGVEEIRYGTED